MVKINSEFSNDPKIFRQQMIKFLTKLIIKNIFKHNGCYKGIRMLYCISSSFSLKKFSYPTTEHEKNSGLKKVII